MRGIAPKRKPDLENKGKLVDDYWSPGQQMLGDIKFLETLKSYDKVKALSNNVFVIFYMIHFILLHIIRILI